MHPKINTCIITGAAGGLGRALVDNFLRAGYYVVAVDQCEKPVDLACDSYIQFDLDRFSLDATYRHEIGGLLIEGLDGRPLNVLINNAAVQILGTLQTLCDADWRKTLNINLMAPLLLAKFFEVGLEKTKGCIVNISSIHARLTKKNFLAYSTSKAALSGFTKSLAIDLGSRVRVVGVEPAALDTKMLHDGFKNDPHLYGRLANLHPAKKIGSPEHLANVIVSLVGIEDSFMTGYIVQYDGGISGSLLDADYFK
jgi:NAD(P)-dependent dehydrogenase (short-subunit alcohol dehydrogenase family)